MIKHFFFKLSDALLEVNYLPIPFTNGKREKMVATTDKTTLKYKSIIIFKILDKIKFYNLQMI